MRKTRRSASAAPLTPCRWRYASKLGRSRPPVPTATRSLRLPPHKRWRSRSGAELVLVLDAGTCDGMPSTVVDCTGEQPKVLREGRLSQEDVAAAVG